MLEDHNLILKSAKKIVCSNSSQLGNPTQFCSLSAAETRWTHLLKTLGKILEKNVYTVDETKQIAWEQKSNRVQKDPVTCARNFDYMVQLFIRDV